MRFPYEFGRIGLLLTSISLASPTPVAAQGKLITEGDVWTFFRGTEDPGFDWASLEFDDSVWDEGPTPIGYGSDKGIVLGTVLDDMRMIKDQQDGYLTVYMRKRFQIPNPAALKSLKISARYDDGFVAYLNGEEVARKSMNPGIPNKDTAALDHEENKVAEAIILACESSDFLFQGENVLAIEGHNVSVSNADFVMSFELEPLQSVCPTELTCTPNNNSNFVVIRWKASAAGPFETLQLFRNNVAISPGPRVTDVAYVDQTPVQGLNTYRLETTLCGSKCSGGNAVTCQGEITPPGAKFHRGDADDNGKLELTDAVRILAFLFTAGPPPTCADAADADDNGKLELTDGVRILRFLFQGDVGPAPPGPPGDGVACGTDPTPVDAGTDLGCVTYTKC